MKVVAMIALAIWIGFLLFGGVSEYLEKRYGGNVAGLFLVVGICGGILLVGSWVL
jgi:hypothetical protein